MTTMTAQKTQVYQLFIKATPEAIWDAITKPEFTERYFHSVRSDFDLRPGGHYRQTMGDTDQLATQGEVLEADPPRRLSHTWTSLYDPEMAVEEPSRVTWEIEARDDGTALLTVTHDQLDGSPKTAESVNGPGWMMVLSGLKTLLETGEPLASSEG
jgi:uncharacterized protein YndB with AHSA1/START domain